MAAQTASLHPNVEHRLVETCGRSPIADLDRYVALFDRPLLNLCNHVWLSEIREAARVGGASVLLTGEIGNWTISAAPRYLLADYLRRGRIFSWAREATAMALGGKGRLRGIAAASFGPWTPDFIWNRVRGMSAVAEIDLYMALNPAVRSSVRRRQEETKQGLARRPSDNFAEAVEAMAELDFGQYRKGVLGGWGLDKRDPTADVRLIEFCLSLPIDLLLKNGVRRPLARAALADRLPAAVLDQPRKGYQAADWADGLSRDLSRVTELIDRIAADEMAAAVIDVPLLRDLVRNWPDGDWTNPTTMARYRFALLFALSAGHFILSAQS